MNINAQSVLYLSPTCNPSPFTMLKGSRSLAIKRTKSLASKFFLDGVVALRLGTIRK